MNQFKNKVQKSSAMSFVLNSFILPTVVIVSMVLCSDGQSSEKGFSECNVSPIGYLYNWNTEEPLKIDVFIPPNWRWRSANSSLYFSPHRSNISFILNATEIKEKSNGFGARTFISFQEDPLAGWTSIFLFFRNNSIQIEDQNRKPMVQHPTSGISPLRNLTSQNILRLKIQGMNAAINCYSGKRTFNASPVYSEHNGNKIKVPVTLFNDATRVSFYSEGQMQILLANEDSSTSFICKELMDPKSDTLQLRNNTESDVQFCDLLPKKHYHLIVTSSMLPKGDIERNKDLKNGFLHLISTGKIVISTDESQRNSQLTDNQTDASFYFLPPLVAVSALLTILILAGIGAIVWRQLRLKMQRRPEDLYSSESWTQKHFDSVRTSELYIKNTVYEKSAYQSGKKFSVTSEYSEPVDDEYDEPIYSVGRESAYESIYESAYSPPLPSAYSPPLPSAYSLPLPRAFSPPLPPELPKVFEKKNEDLK